MEMEVRSSQRVREQHNADLPQLQRAMDLAARKTYGSPPGISPSAKLSLHAFTNSEIKRRAGILGVSLGENESQVDASISALRKVESERGVIFLKNTLPPNNEENESNLVLRKAINICEDLADEEEEVSGDYADLNETLASIKCKGRKRTLSKRAIRRGVRLALYSKF